MNKASLTPLVSIIIPAYNAEKIIQKCIKSIAKQTILKNATKALSPKSRPNPILNEQKVEIILIDDRSLDQTKQKALLASSKLGLNLKAIRLKKHQERGVARNIGSKKARGDYLLFLDSDMQLSNKVLEDCLNTINADPKSQAVIIPEQSFGEGFWTACRSLEKKCYIGNDQIEAARFIEAKAFWNVGGWDPTMISGEDWDLTRRLREKYKVARVNSLIYHYEGRLTLSFTARKKYYYGTTSLPFWRKNLVNSSYLFLMVFRPVYFSKWKLLLSDPIHASGMIILKCVEFTAGAAGLIRSKLLTPPSSF